MIIRLIEGIYSSLQSLLNDKGVRYSFGIGVYSSIINDDGLYGLFRDISYLFVADKGELDSP